MNFLTINASKESNRIQMSPTNSASRQHNQVPHPRRTLQIAKWERHRLARVNELERHFSSQESTRGINKDQGSSAWLGSALGAREAASRSLLSSTPPSFMFSSTFHQPRECFSIKELALAEETKTRTNLAMDTETETRNELAGDKWLITVTDYKPSRRPSSRLNRWLELLN